MMKMREWSFIISEPMSLDSEKLHWDNLLPTCACHETSFPDATLTGHTTNNK